MKKILIVDDEKEIVEFIKNFLRRRGSRVFTAVNGKEAEDIFDLNKPDIVLLDITIPGVNGLDLLKKFKKQNKKAVVIMVTGRNDPESLSKAKSYGAYKYITKPLDLRELHLTISRLI